VRFEQAVTFFQGSGLEALTWGPGSKEPYSLSQQCKGLLKGRTHLACGQQMPAVEIGDVEVVSEVLDAAIDLILDIIAKVVADRRDTGPKTAKEATA
jgi:hypothetical protein